MASPAPYQYQPLSEARREFRVLHLLNHLPEDREQAGPSFEVQTISLNDDPEYTALSYCWGQEPASREIYVNGHPFVVRPNLFDYLELLQEEPESPPIFIDAICISQSDLHERHSQVRLMGDIYCYDATVTAWLGMFDYQTAEVAETEAVSNIAQYERLSSTKSDSSREETLAGRVFGYVYLPEYWTRLWIVQEIAVAEKLVIQHGRLKTDPAMLLRTMTSAGLDMFDYDGEGVQGNWVTAVRSTKQNGDMDIQAMAKIMSVMQARKELHLTKDRRTTLATAISMSTFQHCSILHDKVYGMLGMAVGSAIRVDYRMGLSELYIRAIVAAGIEHNIIGDSKISSARTTNVDYGRLPFALAREFGWLVFSPTIALITQHLQEPHRLLRNIQFSILLHKQKTTSLTKSRRAAARTSFTARSDASSHFKGRRFCHEGFGLRC